MSWWSCRPTFRFRAYLSAIHFFLNYLTYTRASLSSSSSSSVPITAIVIKCFAILYGTYRLFIAIHGDLQSMVIYNQPGSIELFGFCKKIPWYGVRKNVMWQNWPFSQHCHFLRGRSSPNSESLQIHKSSIARRVLTRELRGGCGEEGVLRGEGYDVTRKGGMTSRGEYDVTRGGGRTHLINYQLI